MVIFLLTAISVLCTIYLYTGFQLIRPLHISKKLKNILWAALIICLLLCFSPFVMWIQRPEGPWIDALFRIVFFEFGLFTLLFPLVLARDFSFASFRMLKRIIHFFGKFIKRKTLTVSNKEYPSSNLLMNRKGFLINSGNAALFGVTSSVTGYGLFHSQDPPELQKVTIYSENLPAEFDGFKIAQISDLHVGPSIKRDYVEETVKRLNAAGADLIAVTGDMVDGSIDYLSRDVEALADLHAPSGLYLCTGNHEYYSGVEQWMDAFGSMGINPLNNEHKVIKRGKGKLVIAGVTDYREGANFKGHATDPGAAIKNAPRDAMKILLAHQPRSIFEASRVGFDLQISGHTHGGQYFPYTYLVEFFQPYVAGLYKHENTWIYVNRGAGYWGPPQRMGIPGEITLIELRRKV